jgi:hypothetical protein
MRAVEYKITSPVEPNVHGNEWSRCSATFHFINLTKKFCAQKMLFSKAFRDSEIFTLFFIHSCELDIAQYFFMIMQLINFVHLFEDGDYFFHYRHHDKKYLPFLICKTS